MATKPITDLGAYFDSIEAEGLAKARADIERERNDPAFQAALAARMAAREAELDAASEYADDSEESDDDDETEDE